MIQDILNCLQARERSLPSHCHPIIDFLVRVLTQARQRICKYTSRDALVVWLKAATEQVNMPFSCQGFSCFVQRTVKSVCPQQEASNRNASIGPCAYATTQCSASCLTDWLDGDRRSIHEQGYKLCRSGAKCKYLISSLNAACTGGTVTAGKTAFGHAKI